MIPIPSDNFSIRIDVYNTITNAVLTCKVYGEEDTPAGIVPYLDSFNIIPNVTNASLFSSERRSTKKGIRVQGVNVVYSGAGNVQRGQIFVRGMMFYGDTDTIPAVVLFSDYVTSKNSPGYPGTGLVDSLSGTGHFHLISGTPVGGDEPLNFASLPNQMFRPYSLKAGLTTDATVATRRINVAVTTESGQDIEVSSNITQAASLTYRYNVSRPYYQNPSGAVSTNNNVYLPLLDTIVTENGLVTVTVDNGQSGDTLSGSLYIESWIRA